jgi:hypothetical protein
VALEEVTEEQVLAVLHPTLSYVEDELAAPAEKLTLCGFAPGALSGLRYQKDVSIVLAFDLGDPAAFPARAEVADEVAHNLGNQSFKCVVPSVLPGVATCLAIHYPSHIADAVRT